MTNGTLTLEQAIQLLDHYKVIAREAIDYAEELEGAADRQIETHLRRRLVRVEAYEAQLKSVPPAAAVASPRIAAS